MSSYRKFTNLLPQVWDRIQNRDRVYLEPEREPDFQRSEITVYLRVPVGQILVTDEELETRYAGALASEKARLVDDCIRGWREEYGIRD